MSLDDAHRLLDRARDGAFLPPRFRISRLDVLGENVACADGNGFLAVPLALASRADRSFPHLSSVAGVAAVRMTQICQSDNKVIVMNDCSQFLNESSSTRTHAYTHAHAHTYTRTHTHTHTQ